MFENVIISHLVNKSTAFTEPQTPDTVYSRLHSALNWTSCLDATADCHIALTVLGVATFEVQKAVLLTT
jgi:hypothetical protein